MKMAVLMHKAAFIRIYVHEKIFAAVFLT